MNLIIIIRKRKRKKKKKKKKHTDMRKEDDKGIYSLYDNGSSYGYEERLIVITKGLLLEYTRTLSLVVSIDLSDNNLSGEFPEGITKLFGLVFLNLSMNHITGRIP